MLYANLLQYFTKRTKVISLLKYCEFSMLKNSKKKTLLWIMSVVGIKIILHTLIMYIENFMKSCHRQSSRDYKRICMNSSSWYGIRMSSSLFVKLVWHSIFFFATNFDRTKINQYIMATMFDENLFIFYYCNHV